MLEIYRIVFRFRTPMPFERFEHKKHSMPFSFVNYSADYTSIYLLYRSVAIEPVNPENSNYNIRFCVRRKIRNER